MAPFLIDGSDNQPLRSAGGSFTLSGVMERQDSNVISQLLQDSVSSRNGAPFPFESGPPEAVTRAQGSDPLIHLLESLSPISSGQDRIQALKSALALQYWHQGCLPDAVHCLGPVDELPFHENVTGHTVFGGLLHGLIARARGADDFAIRSLARLERAAQNFREDSLWHGLPRVLHCALALDSGNHSEASEAMRGLTRLSFRSHRALGVLFPGMLEGLKARYQRCQGRQGAMRFARSGLDLWRQLYGRLFESVDVARAGDSSAEGLALLGQAFGVAREAQLWSPVVDLSRVLVDTFSPSDMRQMLEGDEQERIGPLLGTPDSVRGGELSETISEREWGVLKLIAGGLSNQAIADRLHISLHTVKTHARRINAKLGVRSRTQAIVRARELGLIY